MRISASSLVVGVCVLVVLAMGGGTAQAEPILKASSYPVKVEASGGKGKLLAGSDEISCESSSGTGEIVSPGNLGKGETILKGCGSAGAKCHSDETVSEGGNSLEGVSGEVKLVAEGHLVLLNGGPGMNSLQLYYTFALITLAEMLCGIVLIRFVGDPAGNGGLLGLETLEEGVKTKTTTIESKGLEGRQEVTTCEEPVELCGTEPIELLAEFVEGKPESAFIESTATATFSPEVTPEG